MLLWVFGLLLNVFGSIIVNLAANLLKLAHNEEQSKNSPQQKLSDEEKKKQTIKDHSFYGLTLHASRFYWRLGVLLFSAGSLINFLSLSMAAQSLLATLGGVQFVSNIFFAKFILGERITKRS